MHRPTPFSVASVEALETRTMLSATPADVRATPTQATPAAHEVAAKHGGQNRQKHGHTKPANNGGNKHGQPKPGKTHAPTPTPAASPAAVVPGVPAVAPEPAVADPSLHYRSFASDPLFASAGPSEDDIVQGENGDCYFLATLAAVAKADPARIRNSIVDLGDGTFEVKFQRNGRESDVRVDDQLPTTAAGQPGYAGLGAQQSLWVAVMEKAYASFRTGANTYASIDSGWMDEAFAALGASPADIGTASDGASLLASVQSLLSRGKAVTYAAGKPADGASLVGEHAYTVDAVVTDASGNPVALRLRNPWAIDGAGNDGSDDGYVTITAQQAADSMLGIVSATV